LLALFNLTGFDLTIKVHLKKAVLLKDHPNFLLGLLCNIRFKSWQPGGGNDEKGDKIETDREVDNAGEINH
tara:strand:- start:5175 stop:5387 length:213 start_codon:yes stop_codon:yes gene_type:complete